MRIGVMLLTAMLLLSSVVLGARQTVAAGDECFATTKKCVSGRFYRYWQAHGGLAQQGYPLTDEVDEVNPTNGQTYRVQYFERARFEYHPEFAGTPAEVSLGLLGREQFSAKYPNGRPPGGAGEVCFEVTGRCVRGSFYQYWQTHGGLAQQGYPLSDEFDEVSPTNGQTYQVQYFERARFEYHPEFAGSENEVLLGLLGREQYLAKSPGAANPPPNTAPSAPTPTATVPKQPAATMTPPGSTDLAGQVVARTNFYRQQNGCAPLKVNPLLTNAAQTHATEMARYSYLDHTGRDGSRPADRVTRAGYVWSLVAENIAAGYPTAEAVVNGWMASPLHRANILNCGLQEIGVGYAYADNPGSTTNYRWYWVQNFGTPR